MNYDVFMTKKYENMKISWPLFTDTYEHLWENCENVNFYDTLYYSMTKFLFLLPKFDRFGKYVTS